MNIAVIGGGGRVGLPLSVLLATAGHRVSAIDVDVARVALIRSGSAPFSEEGLDDLLKKVLVSEKLRIDSDLAVLEDAPVDVVFVVVGTDLNEEGQPQNHSVMTAVTQIKPYITEHTVVALRSTVMPGTTELIIGLLNGQSKRIAYCPERIAEGKAIEELGQIPQIVGCDSSTGAFSVLQEIFKSLGVESLLATPREAEIGKLVLNTWRYSQFAIANEFLFLCEQHETSYQRIRKLISYQYPRAVGLAGAGLAGGPCLEKDTKQLLAGLKNQSRLFEEVIRTHSEMSEYVLASLRQHFHLPDVVVALLGITFKPDSDDLRSSPALELAQKLHLHVQQLLVVDPHLTSAIPFPLVTLDEALAKCDVVIIGTQHAMFSNIKFEVPVINFSAERCLHLP